MPRHLPEHHLPPGRFCQRCQKAGINFLGPNNGTALCEQVYFVMSSGTGTTDEMIRPYVQDQRNSKPNDHPELAQGSFNRLNYGIWNTTVCGI